MRNAIKARKRRPVFAVDIAVPRDLDPTIAELDDVYLYTVDDLDKVVLEGQSSREEAAVDADRILADEIRRYLDFERSREVAPVITGLRDSRRYAARRSAHAGEAATPQRRRRRRGAGIRDGGIAEKNAAPAQRSAARRGRSLRSRRSSPRSASCSACSMTHPES